MGQEVVTEIAPGDRVRVTKDGPFKHAVGECVGYKDDGRLRAWFKTTDDKAHIALTFTQDELERVEPFMRRRRRYTRPVINRPRPRR